MSVMLDFHFYENKAKISETQGSLRKQGDLGKIIRPFIPIFVLVAILPVFIAISRRPTDVHLNSQAGSNELSVWIEPHNAIMDHTKTMKLTVKAHFENENNFLPGIKVPVSISGPAALESATVIYGKPFRGEVVLGEITVIPQKAGSVIVSINPTSVVSEAFSSPINVSVSKANIEVQ